MRKKSVKITRKKVPESTRLKLWVKSAGRCQFKGCNKELLYNSLTLSDGNFGEVAHIIGAKEDAARGGIESKDLQIAYENLMLMCASCHKEIDDHEESYPSNLLRAWKKEHENRVEIQTSYSGAIHRSTFLICAIKIGERYTPVHFDAIQNAMLPKYPTDLKGIKIEHQEYDRNSPPDVWQDFAERQIGRIIQRHLEEGGDDFQIKHLSIFGIAPMPFLMYLGKCVGDTISADLYQSHRNITESGKNWCWIADQAGDCDFIVHKPINITPGNKVLLKLSISDTITSDRYELLTINEENVYEITVHEPSVHFMKTPTQIECFSRTYRKLLNQIQSYHGKGTIIYLLPALPLCLAVECGRVLLPTKDCPITVCEHYPGNGGFKPVLKLLK